MSARLSIRTATVVLSAAGLAVAGAVVAVGPAVADSRTVVLRATLTGAQEVPPTGDPDGSGRAQVRVKTSTGEICVSVSVDGVRVPAAAAHIHEAPAGASGPVIDPIPVPGADGRSSGCFISKKGLAEDLVAAPQDYYVNIHTSEHPSGAVRGQLG